MEEKIEVLEEGSSVYVPPRPLTSMLLKRCFVSQGGKGVKKIKIRRVRFNIEAQGSQGTTHCMLSIV